MNKAEIELTFQSYGISIKNMSNDDVEDFNLLYEYEEQGNANEGGNAFYDWICEVAERLELK